MTVNRSPLHVTDDGEVPFTKPVAGVAPTAAAHLVTKAYADALGGGGGVTDHGALTGLADDDHTQYARIDGTRNFTGPQGTTYYPTADTHLAPKIYVDASNTAQDAATAAFLTAFYMALGGPVTSLAMATARMLGRTAGGSGAVQEMSDADVRAFLGLGTAALAATSAFAASGLVTASGATMATSRLLGRVTASTGAVEEITLGSGLAFSGSSLVTTTVTPVGIADLTMASGFLGGRTTAGVGPVENITVGAGLTLSAGTLATDAFLASIAALGTAADRMIYTTGVDTAAEATITAAGRALLDDANAAAQRTTLGLVIGTDVQAYDADLAAIAGAGSTTDRITYWTGVGTAALTRLSAFARDLLDDNDASEMQNTLGLVVGTDVQAQDAELSAIAGLTSAADRLPYFTGAGTASLATFTAAGRALVDDADAAAQRTTLGLVIGTNVQAQDAELSAIAGLTSAADRLPYFTGSGTAALATFTAAGRNLVDDADAAAQRTTLGLGTAAVTPATDYQSTLSTELTYVEDFLSHAIGGWTSSNGSGGAAYSTPTAAAANPGVMRVSSGGTSGGSCCARPASSVCFFTGTMTWEAIVTCGADAVGAVMRLGLSNLTTGTADPTDGVFFDYTRASSANWRIRARKASADVTTTSSTAVAFGSYIKLRITFDGTTATFSVNGTSIGTIAAADCPVVVLHPFFFVTQSTASAFTYIDVDRLFFRQTGLSR